MYQLNDARLLPFAVQCYLLTLYKIETLRMRGVHNVEFICRYLTDQRLQVSDTQMLIELLFNEILRHNILDHKYLQQTSVIHEDHAQTLLYLAAHRIKKVRLFARKWILKLIKVIPHIVWEHSLVFLMFDIVLFLDELKQDHNTSTTFDELSYFNVEEAKESSLDFLIMAVDWLETGFSHSTSETLGLMQTYLVSKTRRKISSFLDDKSDLMELFTRFAKSSSISSAIIRSPSKHARFLGEVAGILFIKEKEGIGIFQNDNS